MKTILYYVASGKFIEQELLHNMPDTQPQIPSKIFEMNNGFVSKMIEVKEKEKVPSVAEHIRRHLEKQKIKQTSS